MDTHMGGLKVVRYREPAPEILFQRGFSLPSRSMTQSGVGRGQACLLLDASGVLNQESSMHLHEPPRLFRRLCFLSPATVAEASRFS